MTDQTTQPDELTGASWIGRLVPASTYTMAQTGHDREDIVPDGGSLGQWVTIDAAASTLAVDLGADPGRGEQRFDLTVARQPGGVALASKRLTGSTFEGFVHWMAFDPPLPPGTYVVEIRDAVGGVAWRTRATATPDGVDGHFASRFGAALDGAGHPVDGTRALALETEAASDPVFRRVFDVPGPIEGGTLSAVGLGYGVFRINGHEVSDAVLDPPPTDYSSRVLFARHDVTALLTPGRNVVTAELGRGFWGARGTSVWAWQLAPWHAEPTLAARLGVRLANGTEVTVVSDDTWRAAAGPTGRDLLYGGEATDLRVLPADWFQPGFDDSDWDAAVVVSGPTGALEPSPIPPIRRHAPLGVVDRWELADGAAVHDFGQVTSGWVRLQIDGEPGDRVEVFYGEQLTDEGDVECEHPLYAGRPQIDEVVLGASGPTAWEPAFTYKGFRYARVRTTGRVTVTDIEAVPVHTDVSAAGTFATSDPTLAWIDAATATTILNNLHGIPTDTPLYEKNGWTADAHLIAETAIHHFDLQAFWRKWLRDHHDAQAGDGTIPFIVPSPGWGYIFDPAWNSSYPLIVRNLVESYGDEDVAAEHIDGLLRWAARLHEQLAASGWLWTGYSWGDWLAPGYHLAPEGPTPAASAAAVLGTRALVELCTLLDRHGDAQRLDEAAGRITAAYHTRFFDPVSGTYTSDRAGYRQAMNVLPLAFDMVPEAQVERVVAGLVADLEARTDRHLNCGALSAKYLLPVLSDHGQFDLALAVATQPTLPGWGYWRAQGSSTLWESWDADARSHDHYFLGAIGLWLHRWVAGLRPAEPGYRRFDVVVPDTAILEQAAITERVPAGTISVAWTRSHRHRRVEVAVPAGTEGTVTVPAEPGVAIEVDGSAASAGPVVLGPGRHVVTVGRGD